MKFKKQGKLVLAMSCSLVASALADNPISNYHYLADPAATADDEYFYIITDSDDPAGSNGYTIKSLYAFRSRDMKNWTDFGIVLEAKREYDNIGDIWASGIDIGPDGRFYIVYPDGGGGGVGLVGADEIQGPYKNPVPDNKKLINNWGGGLADCDGIGWCFDPAIFFDDDGQGYFTFGGGDSDSRPARDNNNNIFNIYKLNKNINGFDVSSKVELKIGGPKAMEASYIHKKGSTYYLSYSTADLRIAYGTSSNPMGPYTYKGIFMDNPNINGRNINANNNNHHGIAQFKGKWYVVYHDRRLVQASEHPASLGNANPDPAYHRSVSIDEFTYNGDDMNKLTYTDNGPEQIENFNPYEVYPALTSSKQKNIRSRTDWNKSDWSGGVAAKHVLTPYASKESWIRISGVDFGGGATSFNVVASSVGDGNKIEIHSGSASGTLAGTCDIQKTSGWNDYAENTCEVTGLTGVVDELFLVFKGSKDSTMGILEWSFAGAGGPSVATQQVPYDSVAVTLPAVIEAEKFDLGGARKAYSDAEKANQGDANFRADEGVDIVLLDSADATKGMAVGYTSVGEWLEYTVNVPTEGDYAIKVSASTGMDSASLSFQVDEKDVGQTIVVPKTGDDWSVYKEFTGGSAHLTAGEHVIRLVIQGDNVNVDWFSFGDQTPPTSFKNTVVKFSISDGDVYRVYSLAGKLMGTVDLAGRAPQQALSQAGYGKGVYLLRNARSGKMMNVSTAK